MFQFILIDVSKSKALSAVGEPVMLLRSDHFEETYSVSVLVSIVLDEEPVFITARVESNSQTDFFAFLVQACLEGTLKKGDILICDNAPIHSGSETLEELVLYLKLKEVTLIFLPTYSPELNPCELVFAQVKNYLRNYRDQDLPLFADIALAFAQVTNRNMINYYNKCCCS